MHGHDLGHACGFGKIITRPGVILPLSEENDIMVFGARGDSTAVLMTTNNATFEKQVFNRRETIRQTLREHISWNDSPVSIMEELATTAASSRAMSESAFSSIQFDTGTCLFHDSMFVTTSESQQDAGAPAAVAWRRVCSPYLDPFSENYIVKQLSSVVASFRLKSSSDKALEQRQRIVASAISLLAATAAQVMHLTNGRLTYVPSGHCTYITMPKQGSDSSKYEANLVVNDPTGSGWRVLEDTHSAVFKGKSSDSSNLMSRLETILEFSCKCVVDAILKTGMDKVAMRRAVDSLTISPLSSCSKTGSYPKMAVLTSGSSTVNGDGSLTVLTDDGQQHVQVPLSEFRVDVVVPDIDQPHYPGVSVNIEPRIIGDERLTSPSILQWFNIHKTVHQQVRVDGTVVATGEEDLEEIREDGKGIADDAGYDTAVSAWLNVPVYPVKSPKKWRACQISDKVSSDESWRSKLIRLHKFEWTCKQQENHRSDKWDMFDKIAASVAIVVDKTFSDRSVSDFQGIGANNRCGVDSEPIDGNLVNVNKLLWDIYGFGGNGNKPVVIIDKQKIDEQETEKGDGEEYVLTLIGNAPSATSVRAIRMLKQKNYSTRIKLFEMESKAKLAMGGRCSVACRWYEVSPSTVLGYPSDESDGGLHSSGTACRAKRRRQKIDKAMFLFTPRCLYHTSESYVHLYADDEGPYDRASFSPSLRKLTLGTDRSSDLLNMDVPRQIQALVERPLIIAAAAANSTVTVNESETAAPLGVTSVFEREGSEVEDGEVIGAVARGGRLDRIVIKEERNGTVLWNEITLMANDSSEHCKPFNTDSKLLPVVLSLPGTDDIQDESVDDGNQTGGELSCPNTLEVKCSSTDFYPCPSETAILRYGISNSLKRKMAAEEDSSSKGHKRAFLALAI